MKITTQKRFIAEEFPKEPREWIGRLIQPQNAFNEQIASALTQGLTLADNIKSRTYTMNVEIGQSWPIKLAYPLNERPTALLVGNLQESPLEADPSTLPVAMPTFRMGNGTLDVTVVGLSPLKSYKLTLIALV